ncbi:hypothetical protein C7Y66_04300 [Chroococcidiopsis sp. CCALA 051]|uniref:hypothetical protein n=1 Tax=Chroococcidiopsis sp. CCALA 051 TaxID=869949 RepID=UPI000D0CDA7F|nr:hypothetical protein [Chroococcidiopsis sp. CCALA 051]PSM50379.1 hypothetical protein C7Y66_04300 [Chroococcidiopsis sp. CCALA 051]
MKTFTKIALTAAFAGTLVAAGLARTVYGKQQTPVAVMPQTSSSALDRNAATHKTIAAFPMPLNADSGSAIAANEPAIAPEKNPPGDIPDTQVFVNYKSTVGSYQLEVPEGWARQTKGSNVSFVNKLDGVQIAIANATTVPTANTVKTQQISNLEKSGRAVKVANVKDVKLPGGQAVLIEYTSNSDPDPVTGKQVRIENNNYLFFQQGKLATLRLYAPQGADNVDQWQRISNSFKWM